MSASPIQRAVAPQSRVRTALLRSTVALGLVALPAPAAQDLSDLSLEELARVEVTTATQTSVSIGKAPSTVYSFTAEELRLQGVGTLLELVAFHAPGAFITEDGDELIAAFRGVAVDNNCKVLFLIDGHNANLQYAKGATPELELGLLEDIERVEIVVGPGSALYGSGATIAVINVITKAPPAHGREVSSHAGVGNGGTLFFDTAVRARLSRDWGLVATGGVLRSEGFPKTSSAGKSNEPLDIGRYRLNARASLRLAYGERTELYARFDRVTRAIWNNTVSPTRASPYDTFDYAYVEFRQEVPLGEDLVAKLAASFDSASNTKRDFATGLKIRGVGEDRLAASARLFYTPRESVSLIGGIEYRHDRYGSDWAGDNFSFSPTYDPATGLWSDIRADYAHRTLTPYSRDGLAAFGQATFQLGPELSAVLGGRLDYLEAPNVDKERSFTPRAALVWSPGRTFTSKLMYTSGFRQPMAILTTPDGYFLGGSALSAIDRPETVHSLELSNTWFAHSNLGLTLNAFYNRFDNPHSLTTDTATGKLLFTQGGGVDFVGGEALVQYRLQEKVTLQLAHQLVLLGHKVDDPYHTFKAPNARTLLFYPENVTKGSIAWRFGRGASLSLGGVLVYDSLGYLPSGAVARTGSYALLNANLLLGDPHKTGQFGLGLNNLLDDKTRVPMPATVGRPSDMVPMAGFSFLLSYYRAF